MTQPTDSSPAALSTARELRPGNPPPPPGNHRVKFDPTVSLGHILTFVSLLMAGFGAYNGMDKRITVLEEQRRADTERSTETDRRLKDTLGEMRNDFKELQRSINTLSGSLSVRKDRP